MATFTIAGKSETLTIEAKVSHVDPLLLRYSKTTKIVPDLIVVTYQRDNFKPWEIRKIKVFGMKLLKSGKASDNPFSRHDIDMTSFGRIDDNAPDWVREFVEQNKPLDGCAINSVSDGDLVSCTEPPVALMNIHRRPEDGYTSVAHYRTVGRTVIEPRCQQHLAMDGNSAVPFSTI